MAAGEILHVGAMGQCPHQSGQLMISATQPPRVKVSGQPVVTASDVYTIVGCTFMPGGAPVQCVKAMWPVTATRVKTNGQFVVLKSNASSALCQSAAQAPYGPPKINLVQSRVKGT